MKAKYKKVLRKNITLIMFSLIGTIVVIYVLGLFILRNYEKQVKDIANQTIKFYGNSLDEKLENINSQLVNTLINNETIKRLSEKNDTQEINRSIVQSITKQNELIKYLETLSINYGSRYHFWYFNNEKNIFITAGGGDYSDKELYKRNILKLNEKNGIPITQKRKWFLIEFDQKLFLTTIFRLDDNYIGCWISLESQIFPLLNLEDNLDSTVVLKDIESGKEYGTTYESQKQGVVNYKDADLKDFYICKYNFNYANVVIKMAVYQSLQRKAFIFRVVMMAAAVLIVSLCVGTVYYSRHFIIMPLQIFFDNLKRYRETGDFEQNNSYEEFEEVGEILENLEQEVKQLKVSVYEENLEKQKAQIEYLQLQIRPHFYTNCLNSIFSMAQMQHYEEIQELVRYVTAYMRSIFRKGMRPIMLEEELNNIDNYIQIHKILYRYKCIYKLSVNQEILSAEIPPLLAMIFIENSIKYTAGSKKDVLINIKADYENESRKRIFIDISDSGPGYPEEVLKSIQNEESTCKDDRFQIGIRNARHRLQILYGNEAKLIIQNGDMGGAEVKLLIPFHIIKE